MKYYHLLISICLIFYSICSNAATLLWDKNDCADYYIVYTKLSDDPVWFEASNEIYNTFVNMKTLRYKNDLLLEDVLYMFTVKAFNIYGNSSDFADPVSYTLPSNVIENIVLTLNKNILTWTIKNPETIAGYSLTLNDTGTVVTTYRYDISEINICRLGLLPGVQSVIYLEAIYQSGEIVKSNDIVITTKLIDGIYGFHIE